MEDDDMPLTQPLLVRQPRRISAPANEMEDIRILLENEPTRNIDNVMSDLRREQGNARNIDNVMSDIRNRNQGGRTRTRKTRRTRTRKTRARKSRRTRTRAKARR